MSNITKFHARRKRKGSVVTGNLKKKSESSIVPGCIDDVTIEQSYCEMCNNDVNGDIGDVLNDSHNRRIVTDGREDHDVEKVLDDSDVLCCGDVNSFIPDNPMIVDCMNCRRKGEGAFLEGDMQLESEVHAYMSLFCVIVTGREVLHHGPWNFMSPLDDADSVTVCWQCYKILSVCKPQKGSNGENYCELYGWPAFLRRVLDIGHAQSSGGLSEKIWGMLPINYQRWWIEYIMSLQNYAACDIGCPGNKFTDVTQIHHEWTKEIRKLSTRTLFPFFDKYLSRPQVLCPFGCSEFLNRCNRVSMRKLFLQVLGLWNYKKLSVMVGNKKRAAFLQGMRSDFLEISHNILHLPGWKCRPRLCFDVKRGPQVLCCRYHSSRSSGRYLHVPRPVGGVVACEEDNRFAPVVARPRSTGYVRANRCRRGVYTHTYQAAMAHGQYEGFDTLLLSDGGQFDRMSQVSFARDAVAVYCRPDIKAHVDLLVKEKSIPATVRDAVHEYIEKYVTREAKERMVNSSGGSYISMDDALSLQRQINDDKERRIVMEDGRVSWCRYPWPMMIPLVHNDDEYGAPFPPLPYFKKEKPSRTNDGYMDYRILWSMMALLTSNQQIWSSVAQSVTDEDDWKGWGLMYTLSQCYPYIKRRSSIFRVLKTTGMVQRLYRSCSGLLSAQQQQLRYGPCMIKALLVDVQGLKVMDRVSLLQSFRQHSLDEETEECAILLVLNGENGLRNVEFRQITSALTGYELVTVIGTNDSHDKMIGMVDSRHGGYIGPGWWRRRHCFSVSGRDSILVPQCEGIHSTEVHSELVDAMGGWDVLVFHRINRKSDFDLRLEYMECCGLPTRIRCWRHKMPLIMAIQSRKKMRPSDMDSGTAEEEKCDDNHMAVVPCMVCGKVSYYCCAQPCCLVALCRDHYKETEKCLSSSNDEFYHLEDHLEDRVSNLNSGLSSFIHELQGSHDDLVYDGGMFEDGSIHRGLVTAGSLLQDGNMWTFDNNVAADMEYADSNPSTEGIILTASISGVDFRCQRQYVGSHVILNKHGNLLIRQKGVLKRNQLQNHFISKIVVRSILSGGLGSISGEGVDCIQRTTVPLLYPEGSLFPNMFFKGLGDGSIVGALPAALLSDNFTMGRFGMATIHEHMRTRITSTFLLNSYDNVYLLYALDSCLNLGTRGHDTRVLLKRGWDPELTKGDGIRMSDDADRSDEVLYTIEQLDNRVMCDKVAYAMTRTLPTFFWTFTMNAESCFGMRVLKRSLEDERIIRFIAQKHYESGTIGIPVGEWTFLDFAVLKEQVLASSSVLAMRIYENFWYVFRQYLMDSPDEPFGGTVVHMTDRTELQGAKSAGNLPHHHVALWLKESAGTLEQKERIYEQIRGSVGLIILKDEMEDLVRDGYVSSAEEAHKILDNLAIFLPHKCHARCMRLFRGGSESRGYDGDVPKASDGDVDVEKLFRQGYRCKVPDNHKLSPSPNAHVFRKIERPHCPTVRNIFRELGLLWDEVDPISGRMREVLDERLYAVHHIPPTTPEHGITSPVLARLVLLLPGNQNVQLLDSVLAARYLTKYMIMLDESNRLYAMPPSAPNQEPTMNVDVDVVPNTKVTSIQKDQEEKKKASRKNFVARIVGAPESVMLLLNFEQIFTTHEFVKVVTTPLEERPGLERKDPRRGYIQKGFLEKMPYNLNDVDTSRLVLSHRVRLDWIESHRGVLRPPIRPFDSNALIFAKDQCFSRVTMDSVTQFSLRPPELYWVRHQKIYQECFQVDDIRLPKRPRGVSEFDHAYNHCARILHKDYEKCGWVDGSFKRIKARASGLETLVEYIATLKDDDFHHVGMRNSKITVVTLFCRLERLFRRSKDQLGFRSIREGEEWRFLSGKFLCQLDRRDRPVAYFKRVPPKLGHRFLYSLLLGMGKFTTEMDISNCGSTLQAFIKTDLIDPNDVRGSMNALLKRYIVEHMFTQGGGTDRFDEDLVTAYHVLNGALFHNHTVALETPPVLITRLQETLSDETHRYLDEKQNKLMTFVLKEMEKMSSATPLPTLSDLKEMSVKGPSAMNMSWSVDSMVQSLDQNLESFREQSQCLQIFKSQLHDLVHMNHVRHPKCICIVGGPGCGKTTLMVMGMLHAMCMSLRCMTTALLSNRADQLAGIHWHRLFKFPVEGLASQTAGGLAEQALSNLFRYGHLQIAMIRYVDAVCVDELGPFAAKLFAAGEMVCRRIRKCNLFFGGLFLFSTYDVFQLFPIADIPPLLSPHMMTCFRFCELTVSVRAAADDHDLRELQQLTRTLPDQFTRERKNRFVELFVRSCSFVDDFDDPSIPSNAIYIFGKRKPGRDLRDKRLRHYRTTNVPRSVSKDQQRTSKGEWREASEHVMGQLDSHAREDRELYFVPGFVYEITDNKKGKYNHHQICMLWDIPSSQDLDSFYPIPMMVAPTGCTDIPAFRCLNSKQDLVDRGWEEMTIGTGSQRSVKCKGGMHGKRKQYALRLHVFYTLHVSMGCTLPAVCSAVSSNSASPFYVWEKAQVIVLLSRTRYAKNMYFVGNPRTIANDLLNILLREGQYFRHMLHVLDVMLRRDKTNGSLGTVPPVITFQHHPFRPIDVPLPSDNTGYCYLLISLRAPDAWYIGETVRLGERLNQHNTGIGGALQTKSLRLRPWAMLCFVCGFERDVDRRKRFEQTWQHRCRNFRHTHRRNPTPQDVVDIGGSIISTWNQSIGSDLTMILAGDMQPSTDLRNDVLDVGDRQGDGGWDNSDYEQLDRGDEDNYELDPRFGMEQFDWANGTDQYDCDNHYIEEDTAEHYCIDDSDSNDSGSQYDVDDIYDDLDPDDNCSNGGSEMDGCVFPDSDSDSMG